MSAVQKSPVLSRQSSETSAIAAASKFRLQDVNSKRHLLTLGVQPKLTMSSPNDAAEIDADQVADAIVDNLSLRGTQSRHSLQSQPLSLARKCNVCEEEEKENLISRAAVSGQIAASSQSTTPHPLHALSSGTPLPISLQLRFESGFGVDFSAVRIHNDATAHAAARGISAHAYASGNDIAFAAGQYQPHTSYGQRLLAHELTHVVQQRGGSVGAQAKLAHVGKSSGLYVDHSGEIEADRVANSIMAGQEVAVMGASTPGSLQGQFVPELPPIEPIEAPSTGPGTGDYYLKIWTENDNPNCCLTGTVGVSTFSVPWPAPRSVGHPEIA